MKQITLLCATLFLFIGCGNYMSEVWVNDDSSGEAKVTIDAGEMIDMVGMALQEMDDEEDKERLTDDDSLFGEGIIDSTLVLYDLAPDSVKQKMNNPELLKNMIFEMKGDADKREMLISMSIHYKSEAELADFFSELAAMQEDGAQVGGAMSQEDMKKIFDNQTIDHKNGIVRITRQNSIEELEEQGLFDDDTKSQLDSLRLLMSEFEMDEDKDVELNELAFLKQMLDADVKTVYYLPGKVQFTNDRTAVIDGNTVTFSDNIWDVIMAGEMTDSSDRIIKYKAK